jgi:hypothetical protein
MSTGQATARRNRQRLLRRNVMVGRFIKLAVLAVIVALIVQSLPDIKRYLRLREM